MPVRRLKDSILGRQGDKISKRTILWTVVIVVAFVGGFGVGTTLWEFNAYDYFRGEPTIASDTLTSST
jgi:hypothetical protein